MFVFSIIFFVSFLISLKTFSAEQQQQHELNGERNKRKSNGIGLKKIQIEILCFLPFFYLFIYFLCSYVMDTDTEKEQTKRWRDDSWKKCTVKWKRIRSRHIHTRTQTSAQRWLTSCSSKKIKQMKKAKKTMYAETWNGSIRLYFT